MKPPSTKAGSKNGRKSGSENGQDADAERDATQPEPSAMVREFQSLLVDIENLIKAAAHLSVEELEKVKEKLNKRIAAAKKAVDEMD